MTRSVVDLYLLLRKVNNKLEGAIIIQLDDSFGVGVQGFLGREDSAVATFMHKPRFSLGTAAVSFN